MTPHSPIVHSSIPARRARRDDLKAILHLIEEATERGKILKRSRKDVMKNLRHFFVIEEEGRVIACCALEVYNAKLAEIRSLVVEKGKERQGLATRLVEGCITHAKKRKIYEVLAITDRENLFKRTGFSEQLHGQKALFLRP